MFGGSEFGRLAVEAEARKVVARMLLTKVICWTMMMMMMRELSFHQQQYFVAALSISSDNLASPEVPDFALSLRPLMSLLSTDVAHCPLPAKFSELPASK